MPKFGISKQEAMNRLNHGFAVHFTTPKIGEEILKNGKLVCTGKNAMFSEEEDKKIVFDLMNNIYDRLIGDEQNVCCILIDRDAFEYEIDYHYEMGTPVGIERRPFSINFSSLMSNDLLIKNDINASYLKFLKIPTILELERQKAEQLKNSNSLNRL